ncbi:metallophosphoesterase [bacterium]|nr:metallophosphoesterase [bacterium]
MATLAEPLVERYGKIVRIPPGPGRAIVSTDLHGHMEDFRRVVAAFERALTRGNAYLVFTGDLVHGPAYEKDSYPEHLGDYYEDETPLLMQSFVEVQKKHRGRVICLMGNHEHSHVGGPHTRKFHKTPSETEYFERKIGPKRTSEYQGLFRSFPLVCVAGKGVVITHGAPRVLDATFAEICAAEYGGHETKTIPQMLEVPILGELFWARAAGSLCVRRFLRRVEIEGQKNHIAIYGHDPVRRGWAREGAEQLCFSTSFALRNARKVYIELDLERVYPTVDELKLGREIRWLYPELGDQRKKK